MFIRNEKKEKQQKQFQITLCTTQIQTLTMKNRVNTYKWNKNWFNLLGVELLILRLVWMHSVLVDIVQSLAANPNHNGAKLIPVQIVYGVEIDESTYQEHSLIRFAFDRLHRNRLIKFIEKNK